MSDHLVPLLEKHISSIQNTQQMLDKLLLEWSVVSVISKINNNQIGTQFLDSISQTESKFIDLSQTLIKRILGRYLGKLHVDLHLHSEAFMEILNRNLFERSADIGFLAMDTTIAEFMAQPDDSNLIDNYLQEYVNKYTVYNDILLLDTNGEVLTRLNKTCRITKSHSPLFQQALTSEDFIQSDQPLDVLPEQSHPLVFVQSVEHLGHKVGVLCLVFKFKDELERIYQTLKGQTDFEYHLINASEQLLYSSHQTDSKISLQPAGKLDVVQNNKLCLQSKAKAYQGFSGLAWQCQVSIQLEQLLKRNPSESHISLSKTSRLYPTELNALSTQINRALKVSLSNGRVISLKKNSKSFLPILDSYQRIGLDVQDIFANSIRQIHQIATKTVQEEVAFLATLALDIIDRNLYERGNDCRWWALNKRLKQDLTGLVDTRHQAVKKHLQTINQLYTVYATLYILDEAGTLIAHSCDTPLQKTNFADSENFQLSKTITHPQQYRVSNFSSTPFYQNRPTYIHSAAIFDDQNQKFLGSINLVFNAQEEFQAILEDFIPKDSDGKTYQNAFSMLLESSAEIVSITQNPIGLKVQDHFSHFEDILKRLNSEHGAIQYSINNTPYLIGYQSSKGYREFKQRDNYSNDLHCMVFVPA